MLLTVPPLWKDVDAYIQVTFPPGRGTILQYGPLYCFLARVPLYLGYAFDCLRKGATLPTAAFFVHPVLSNSGVLFLLIAQHLALVCAACYLIATISRSQWIRVMLAAIWAANPLFYAFAHCVGSETLSMILILLLAATGLRIICRRRSIGWRLWFWFAVFLWLCVLTRHINASLAGLLPLTFLLMALYRLAARVCGSRELHQREVLRAKSYLQKTMIGIAIGVGCLLLANVNLRIMCQTAGIPYYSSLGFTFAFRLGGLTTLSPRQRNELLDRVAGNTDAEDVKHLVALLRESFPSPIKKWDVMGFLERAQRAIFPERADPTGERFGRLLNRTAAAFLWPPRKQFLGIVERDFAKSQEITTPQVVGFLFLATAAYFRNFRNGAEVMPQLASLVTFSGKDAAKILGIPKEHPYLRHPKIQYRSFLLIWLIPLVLCIRLEKQKNKRWIAVVFYAVALVIIGLFMTLANCFLNELQPRYTLPMWELTIVSAAILLGHAGNRIKASANRAILCGGPVTPPVGALK